eukprot:453036_1
MAEQATEEKKEEKKEESGKMKASKELFDKRKDLMDLQSKADFKEGDKFSYLCDDGVLIECEVIRPHSKGGKVFVSLGEHHGHLTENHSCWIDLPNTRICSLQQMFNMSSALKFTLHCFTKITCSPSTCVEILDEKNKQLHSYWRFSPIIVQQ